MSINKKDGTPFRLVGPNPLMKQQDDWKSEEQVVIHNLQPEEVVGQDVSRDIKIPNPYEIIDAIPQSKADDLVVPTKVTPEPEIPNKIVAWCLLALVHERTNPLYGETSQSISYTEKFSFETVILRRGDIDCDLWSPATHITKHSIVYLWKQREWWRVNDIKTEKDGIILNCYPSDSHPSF